MKVDVIVLCSCMKHWISWEICHSNVLTPQPCHRRMRHLQLSELLLNPHCFSRRICQSLVLCFNTRSWHSGLLSCAPWYKDGPKEHCKSSYRVSIINTPSPICVREGTHYCWVIFSPILNVPWIYLMIRFTALQCIVVGACKNWQTLFTANDMSGLVSVKYWSAPSILLYRVESTGPSFTPSDKLNLPIVDMGVSTSLLFSIFVRLITSATYLCWVSNNPSEVFFTSMPRKQWRSPRSFRENSFYKSFNNAFVASTDELATMISSTYTSA
jgi:hypothetical protein